MDSTSCCTDDDMMRKTTKSNDDVLRLIFAKRGTATRIAEACGVKRQAIDNWSKVPDQHVETVARILNMKPWDVRPDLYRPRRWTK